MNTFSKRFSGILIVCIGCTFFAFSDSNTQQNTPAKTSSSVQSEKKTEKSEPSASDSTSTEAVKAADDAEKGEEKKKDALYSSIQDNSLMLADGNRWYYEGFDPRGRVVFTVLYEGDKELERMTRRYESSASVYPVEQTIVAGETKEIIRYTPSGKELRIEKYGKDKKVIEKTENTYDSDDNLIVQVHTEGAVIEKTVWKFLKGTAVSQLKYRNGEKTAFIELKKGKRIVHIYKNDKEVFVTEEK